LNHPFPPWREALTLLRQGLECRNFGEPVLCETNTRLLAYNVSPQLGAAWTVDG